MNYTPTDLEAFVRQRAPEIARDIQAAARRSAKEADLVAEVERILERFERNFDVSLRLERGRTLINGRADAVYNRFVIEYEPPGSLRKSNSYRANRHAINQVKQYMEGLERLDRHRKERLAGAVLDGYYFIFIRFRDGRWRVDDPIPVSAHSTATFLRYLLSLSTELALTPENLVRDFGENTVVSRMAVSALYNALRTTGNPKVQILFQQWRRLFSEICGYEEGSTRLNVAKLAKSYGVKDTNPNALRLFFAIHTYYAVFIKLLAVQVAHYYLMPKVGTGLAQIASADTESLRSYLQKMEQGGIFADFGIKNFLEGDFFGWYLDAWEPAIEDALRRIIGDLANYSLVTLDVNPEETRDLLKQLYQNLVPKKLRHDLGEYYTPDWLAERLLNQLGVNGDPRKRLLDPACGSGTFLVLTIKRIKKYAEERMLPEADVLDRILENVVGFDLNPLAVITARTNYLLALGDLLPHRRGEISIPVYLTDSIMTPQPGKELSTYAGVEFSTAVGRFAVPRSLVDAHYIDQLADLLEESVKMNLSAAQFRRRLLQTFPLIEGQDEAEISVAVKLYERLLDLERRGINGIWARIIKNAFAPLFQGRFDYVAGNPPWVNWESLPDEYRQETASLWAAHELFPHKGFDAILGKAKDDIFILMTYVALDKYVRAGGRLGFLITQSVFKTAGAGQGFRRFRLGDGTPLGVIHVDDMADLKPFEGASNRTAIVVLERGRMTRYPVPYTHWRKKGGGAVIPEDLSLEEVQEITVRRNFVAEPVDKTDPTSPWITGRPRALQAIRKVLGASNYRARAGIYTGGANGVYWLEIIDERSDGLVMISNITKGARRKVESVQAAIEPDLLYPLLRGRDVQRWGVTPSAHILVTHEPGMKLKAIPEDEMVARFPKTYAYLKWFEDDLLERRDRGVRGLIEKGAPFYSMFAVGDYTFAPYKVVWREQAAGLTVAVVEPTETKAVVPDHKLMMVDFQDKEEAHYLCAALNSSPARLVVISYGVSIQMDTHVLENVRVPLFDPDNPTHCQLAVLSVEAHEATAAGDTARVQEIEAEIDRLAAELWGLTEEELRDIQKSLEELG
ncbi:SAM-dependent DNA methyltransferase [Candidatus Poribacteria bacterium]|nr:SAM-dependent DNA methyltransferase [Candidatus Poribacteria bacterium]